MNPVSILFAQAGRGLARSSAVLLFALVMAMPHKAFGAERVVTVTVVETVEYVEYGEAGRDAAPALARYGPFAVIAPDTAELVGDTDSYSPGAFAAMLRDWPGLRTLRLVECGGTVDDVANLDLARAIRRAGLATHVPASGSVRSGGVELFLAGVRRTAEPGAEFVVHSWRDEWGREARDVPAGDPIHRSYLSYYREIGLAPERARAFYALTNSVPNDDARRLTRAELAAFGLID